MTYNLLFDEEALKEFKALEKSIKEQLKKKLSKVLENPHVPKNKLKGFQGSSYKIKLRASGIRCIYTVNDQEITISVIAIGARSDNDAYKVAKKRLNY